MLIKYNRMQRKSMQLNKIYRNSVEFNMKTNGINEIEKYFVRIAS